MNPQTLRHQILSLACLPIPPPPHRSSRAATRYGAQGLLRKGKGLPWLSRPGLCLGNGYNELAYVGALSNLAGSANQLRERHLVRRSFSLPLGFINPRRAYIIVVLVAIITAAAMSYRNSKQVNGTKLVGSALPQQVTLQTLEPRSHRSELRWIFSRQLSISMK